MAGNTRMTSLVLTVVLAALNLIALNFLISGWSSARLDLTEENLFSKRLHSWLNSGVGK